MCQITEAVQSTGQSMDGLPENQGSHPGFPWYERDFWGSLPRTSLLPGTEMKSTKPAPPCPDETGKACDLVPGTRRQVKGCDPLLGLVPKPSTRPSSRAVLHPSTCRQRLQGRTLRPNLDHGFRLLKLRSFDPQEVRGC